MRRSTHSIQTLLACAAAALAGCAAPPPACGSSGGPCCDGIACNPGLVCLADACKAPSGGGSASAGGGSGGGSGGLSSTGGNAEPVSPSSICSLYVGCMSKAAPSGMAAILAAYGPAGSCWATSATATVCDQACLAGIEQERAAFSEDCPLCASDSDCAGSTPVCSSYGSCTCAPTAHACDSDEACCSGLCSGGVCACAPDGQPSTSPVDCCSSGSQICNGLCTPGSTTCCPVGQTACGEEGCIDTGSDPANCGGCGTLCRQGGGGEGAPSSYPAGVCSGGQCSCAPSSTLCTLTAGPQTYLDCADTSSDSYNCGGCGLSCDIAAFPYADGESEASQCTDGQCACTQAMLPYPGTPALCPEIENGQRVGWLCTDTSNDPWNCGACGTFCPGTGDATCSSCGSCSNGVCSG